MADLISTTVLTFSVVRANMVWVDTDEGEDDEKYVPLICLCYSLIFLLDFVSKWFRQYSIYLAGERTEAVSNEIETRMLELAYSRPIDIIMYSQVNIWLAVNYMYKFPKIFKVLFPVLDAASNMALAGLGIKIYVNLIELK